MGSSSTLDLGPISLIDCFFFLIFLVINLLLTPSLYLTLFIYAFKILPFLVLKLPVTLVYERFILPKEKRSPFARQASGFEDLVIRCVRFAFATIPASVGKVFFSKWVSKPFFWWRLFRTKGLYMNDRPFCYREVIKPDFRALHVALDQETLLWAKKPDVVIYYCHGGGFAMGSSYFYLEFLATLVLELHSQGFHNPALLALEYTLVPTASYPTQPHQTTAGFDYLTNLTSASNIVLAGDSAGATLMLTHLLHHTSALSKRPGLALLISPWTHLVSPLNRATKSDYLDPSTLELYARQYAGEHKADAPRVSPGHCRDGDRWRRGAPEKGFAFVYGSQEVFAPGISELVELLRKEKGLHVTEVIEGEGGIHAWPVVVLFLKERENDRMKGVRMLSTIVAERMGVANTPKQAGLLLNKRRVTVEDEDANGDW